MSVYSPSQILHVSAWVLLIESMRQRCYFSQYLRQDAIESLVPDFLRWKTCRSPCLDLEHTNWMAVTERSLVSFAYYTSPRIGFLLMENVSLSLLR